MRSPQPELTSSSETNTDIEYDDDDCDDDVGGIDVNTHPDPLVKPFLN